MKKLLVAIALAGLASTASATITGSKHDFTDNGLPVGTDGRAGQICIYCHTPHGTNPADPSLPLWNRAYSATKTYTPYLAANLQSGHAVLASNFSPGTRACLSCHDGSMTDVSIVYFNNQMDISTGALSVVGLDVLGTDLSNDHPIGMLYASPQMITPGQYKAKPTTLPFFTSAGVVDNAAGFMQCSSCHEVHNQFNATFILRQSNQGSQLCLLCHDK